MKRFSKIASLFIAGIISQSAIFAQSLPIVGNINPRASQNILSGGLTDQKQLIIQNTGTVPLNFCMANAASTSCTGLQKHIQINAGATATVSVAQLGGISAGVNLNATNESGTVAGRFAVMGIVCGDCVVPPIFQGKCQPVSGNTSVFGIAKASPIIFPSDLCTKVGIGTDNPQAVLDVNGDALMTNLTLNGNPAYDMLVVKGNSTLSTATINNLTAGQISGNAYFTGSIGIGTTKTNGYALSVNGNVRANHVKVYSGWADYVFHKNYNLMPIAALEQFINENGHLPEIPPASEIENNGVDLGDMSKLQMAKIEELTMYIIQQQKQLDAQKVQIEKLQQLIKK